MRLKKRVPRTRTGKRPWPMVTSRRMDEAQQRLEDALQRAADAAAELGLSAIPTPERQRHARADGQR